MKNAVNTLKTTTAAAVFTLFTNAAVATGYNHNNNQPDGPDYETEITSNPQANSASHSGANANAGVKANLGQSTNVGVGQSAKLNGGNTHVDNEIETGDVSVHQGPVTAGGAHVGVQNGNKNYVEGTDVETEITGTNTNTNNIGPVTSTSKGGNGYGGDVEAEISDNSDRSQTQTTDASSQNENSQTSNQQTNVDNSGSGNSENENTQNTEVGGNNSSYTNNSVYKAAARVDIPEAASIFATKSCVASHSFGFGVGTVAGAGGLSWSHVGSEAVALTGTIEGADGEQIDVAYTIPELADMSAQDRAGIVNNLQSSEAATATCLMSNYQAQERSLTKAYEQATNVAKINAKSNIAGKKIDGYTNIKIEEIRQAGQATTASVNAQGEIAQIGMKHICNQAVTVIQTGANTQQVVDETLAIPRNKVSVTNNGHELCGIRTGEVIESLKSHTDNSDAVEVDFGQFDPQL